ncbi:MAG: PLP-dependent aminotransferase family protein [Solirubrobacterales bacterium]
MSFARGAPSLDIVDVEGLREAAALAFAEDAAGLTGYGTAIGYPPLRAWIAEQHGVDPRRSSSPTARCRPTRSCSRCWSSAGDSVVVEKPTYDRTLLNLRKYRRADIHMIDLEPDGLDVAALHEALDAGLKPTLAHIIPNFQNPAGYTLSREKRSQLLALAAEHGFTIFEDDPYVALRFAGEMLPTMLSLDEHGSVVYASSFSKTVCPGVRVGYLVGPAELIARITALATHTYISPSMVAQGIVYQFCASGRIRESIETVKAALAERAGVLCAALEREIPDARFVAPEGGYFLWVELPEGTDVAALFAAAAERGVQIVKGTDFLLEGGENTLRLAYSGVRPAEIEEGVARLAQAYRALAPAPA